MIAKFRYADDAARDGDEGTAGSAFSLLYDDLRRLAHSRLRQHRTMTLLNTTSLVHESYMKLVGIAAVPVEDGAISWPMPRM